MKKVVFISSTFNQVGGGERLILEGIRYYEDKGYEVFLITWNFSEQALFNNKYKVKNLINLNSDDKFNISSYNFAFKKLIKIFNLRRKIFFINPDFIISPSENDTTFLYLTLLFSKIKYSTLIFGQMFQIPEDPTRYSLIFRKNLKIIVDSFVGYKETISLKKPKLSMIKNFIIEIWSILKYIAVKNSDSIIVFSKQVQWEVYLLYGRDATIQKGAFRRSELVSPLKENLEFDFKETKSQIILLMINRLEKKKRTDLAIKAVKLLTDLNIDVKLIIGGKGREFDNLKYLTNKYKIENKVIFLGYVAEENLNSIVSSIDIFLSLDIADFNISPFSALVLQKPVIWTEEMDMDEYLIKSKLINVVKPSPENVANTIQNLIANLNNDFNKEINIAFLDNYTYEKYFEIIETKTLF
jgi:glycosyltransferase involved in cell wall biosynthesis